MPVKENLTQEQERRYNFAVGYLEGLKEAQTLCRERAAKGLSGWPDGELNKAIFELRKQIKKGFMS